jgi:hypothetical protein
VPDGEDDTSIGATRNIIFKPLSGSYGFLDSFTYFGPNIGFLRLLGVKKYYVSFFPNFPYYKTREKLLDSIENWICV